MWNYNVLRLFYFYLALSFLMISLIEGKTLGMGNLGSLRGSLKRYGPDRRPSSYSRAPSYGIDISRPRTGSSFRKNAIGFATGAAGGLAAYSIMRSLSRSHRHGDYYGRGYGGGETCTNNENLDGTVFGRFRCPLYGFPYEARYCCGEYGREYCCTFEERASG